MTDLVKRNGFEVPFGSIAGRRDRPGKGRVEKDVGLDQLTSDTVDQKTGRCKDTVKRRFIEKSECRPAIVFAGPIARVAAELIRDRGRGHRLPGRKGA